MGKCREKNNQSVKKDNAGCQRGLSDHFSGFKLAANTHVLSIFDNFTNGNLIL